MDSIRKFTFKEPKSTDKKLDFDTYHGLVMAVARELGISVEAAQSPPVMRLMELDDDLPAYDPESEDEDGNLDFPYVDKKATPLYYNDTTKTWERDGSQQKVNVCNHSASTYPKGQRLTFLYLAQCAKWVPFSLLPTLPRWVVCRGQKKEIPEDVETTLPFDSSGGIVLYGTPEFATKVDGKIHITEKTYYDVSVEFRLGILTQGVTPYADPLYVKAQLLALDGTYLAAGVPFLVPCPPLSNTHSVSPYSHSVAWRYRYLLGPGQSNDMSFRLTWKKTTTAVGDVTVDAVATAYIEPLLTETETTSLAVKGL
jgi:hypothetical protein